MGVTLTDVLLFGKAQLADVDNATFVIYRRNILRWSALGGYLDIIVKGVSPLSLPDAIADSLEYLKAFGGTEQRNLPDGYIQRQFIYMMDGSYLLTDIVPTYDGHYEMDFQTTTVSNVAAAYLGGRAGQSPAGLIFSHGSGNALVTDAFGQRYNIVERVENNTRYKYVFNNKVFTLYKNGEVVETHTFTSSDNSGAALAIKAINMAGTIDFAGESIYLYGFKAWNRQGELVADYVPAIQKGTVPVVGFYDTVSGTFKTATAGTFAAGGEAVPTPDTPMDIVSNNGVLKYGYQSVNMFDKDNTLADNRIWAPNFSQQDLNGYYGTNIIKVIGGHTYTRSGSHGGANYFKLSDGTYTQTSDSSATITVPNNAVEWVFNNTTATDRETMMVVEGSSLPEEYVPYKGYGIYTDGTVETISVHGKNLYNDATRTNGYYIGADGVIAQGSGTFCYSALIPVKPNTAYILSGIAGQSGQRRLHAYDSNGDWISQISFADVTTGNTYNATGTTPNNCVYVRISIPMLDTNVQLEQGSTATTYEPYYDGGTATAEMLLKVGDYQDVQSIIDGVVTRKVGVKVLDGTENTAIQYGMFKVNAMLPVEKNSGWQARRLCSHGVAGAASATNNMIEVDGSIIWFGGKFITDMGWTTAEDGKAWIAQQYAAGTPVTVIYPLATPTTESVAGQTLQVTDGDNIVEITQASLNGLELEAQYQAAVSLTIQEVQDANLDPNVEVTIN